MLKRISQAQRSKVEGFYASQKATSDSEKASAIRRLLGLSGVMDLRELENIFVFRFIQHV